MNRVNEIIFDKRRFLNETLLYAAVAQQLQALISSGYKCVVKGEESGGIIVIQYSLPHEVFGSPEPYWLFEAEAEQAQEFHDQIEIANAKLTLKNLGDRLDEDIEEMLNLKNAKDKKPGGDA